MRAARYAGIQPASRATASNAVKDNTPVRGSSGSRPKSVVSRSLAVTQAHGSPTAIPASEGTPGDRCDAQTLKEVAADVLQADLLGRRRIDRERRWVQVRHAHERFECGLFARKLAVGVCADRRGLYAPTRNGTEVAIDVPDPFRESESTIAEDSTGVRRS